MASDHLGRAPRSQAAERHRIPASLTETELLGRFRFKQRCALCHAAQTNLSTVTWGPLLTQRNVTGREAIVRERILEGSPRMPAFKYTLDTATIDAIIAYLLKVERLP